MRAVNWFRHGFRLGLPTALGIELSTACNRSCSYCPQSINKPKQSIISPMVWRRFLEALREFGWNGMVGLHRFGEPTLVPRLELYVHDLKVARPRCLPVLFTNGDRPEVIERCLRAGLARAIITCHEGTDEMKWIPPLEKLRREFGRRRK